LNPGEKAAVGGFDRVFIGSETCGCFLSSPGFPDEIKEYVLSGHEVGIISPFLTPEREISFIALLKSLSGATGRAMEVVVNDVGAFRLVQNNGHTPIIGRLLMRQNTDPAIPSFFRRQPDRDVYDYTDYVRLMHANPPQALADHFAGSPVFSKEAAALFLAGREELTVMMDIPPLGLPAEVPERFRVMLNMDDVLVSVLPCRSCDGCPEEETQLGRMRAGVPIYRRKSLCYYKAPVALDGRCTPGGCFTLDDSCTPGGSSMLYGGYSINVPSYVSRLIARPTPAWRGVAQV